MNHTLFLRVNGARLVFQEMTPCRRENPAIFKEDQHHVHSVDECWRTSYGLHRSSHFTHVFTRLHGSLHLPNLCDPRCVLMPTVPPRQHLFEVLLHLTSKY
jgi:hypothetical protein